MTDQLLAYRRRPNHIREIVGQKHVIGEGSALHNMVMKGFVPSFLLYGEPGIGKTSIASAIAGTLNIPFFKINATESGVKDIEQVINEAEKYKAENDKISYVILFIDEIHAFSKKQQDKLLPRVEEGIIRLIGATSENPYFSVNPAVRSRCGKIYQLRRLSVEDIKQALRGALEDKERGLGTYKVKIAEDCLHYIATASNGEVRSALNSLEMAAMATDQDKKGVRTVTIETAKQCSEGIGFSHDRDGDNHYNILSALQKSCRGSSTDAALFYAAQLVLAGDLKSLLRRLVVIAYEDVADPMLGAYAETTARACERVGWPEATGILSNLIVALCNSPKAKGMWEALGNAVADVEAGNIGEIPMHLRDTHYKSAVKLGHVGYDYPHNHPQGKLGSWVAQQYLPDGLTDRQYYFPQRGGEENEFAVGEKNYAQMYLYFKQKQQEGLNKSGRK